MQLDVDIEPTLRFPGMTRIDKQMDQSESHNIFRVISIYLICISTTDRRTDRQTDRQTDRKRRIRAHRATCTGGLKKN